MHVMMISLFEVHFVLKSFISVFTHAQNALVEF